jgi:hypothetical protein
MMDVTPIQHQPTYEKLRNVPWEIKMLEWLEKTDIFVQYLIDEDCDYARIPDHNAFDGQRRLIKNLSRLANRIHADFLYEKERRSGQDRGYRRRTQYLHEQNGNNHTSTAQQTQPHGDSQK